MNYQELIKHINNNKRNTTMELLDVIFDCVTEKELPEYYLVMYKDVLYRKYKNYWTIVIHGNNQGFGSVDNTFSFKLDKEFKKLIGINQVRKKNQLFLSIKLKNIFFYQ